MSSSHLYKHALFLHYVDYVLTCLWRNKNELNKIMKISDYFNLENDKTVDFCNTPDISNNPNSKNTC
jgi:hypothetical protein